jgi:hypothetical protein
MKATHTTSFQRVIAYVLLVSQLLTSCGLNENILPSTPGQEVASQQEKVSHGHVAGLSMYLVEEASEAPSSLQEGATASSYSIVPPTCHVGTGHLTLTVAPLILQAKGGHEVTVSEDA